MIGEGIVMWKAIQIPVQTQKGENPLGYIPLPRWTRSGKMRILLDHEVTGDLELF
jgi:hypothetical protein